jgi:hypothetical protein
VEEDDWIAGLEPRSSFQCRGLSGGSADGDLSGRWFRSLLEPYLCGSEVSPDVGMFLLESPQ